MARKSKLVAFRMPERMGWKLEKMGERNGLSAAQMAKLMVMEQVGRLSEQEEKQFIVQVERPRQGQERVAQATTDRAPAMAPRRRQVTSPPDVAVRDTNGWLVCPDCGEASMIEDGEIKPTIGILKSETGWFTCHRVTCGAMYEYPPFIGLPETHRGADEDD